MQQTTNQPQIASEIYYSYVFTSVLFLGFFIVENPTYSSLFVAASALYLSDATRKAKAAGVASSVTSYMGFVSTALFVFFGYVLWTT
jgi:hypothetical protein